MFGHSRGRSRGADRPKVGKLDAAPGGTLPRPALQDELLVAGRPTPRPPIWWTPLVARTSFTDARVIAATNSDLVPLIDAGPSAATSTTGSIPSGSTSPRYGTCARTSPADRPLPPGLRQGDQAEARASATTPARSLRRPRQGNAANSRHSSTTPCLLLVARCPGDLPKEVSTPCGTSPMLPPVRYREARKIALGKSFDESYLISDIRDSGGIVSRCAGHGISQRNFHKKLVRYQIDFEPRLDPGCGGRLPACTARSGSHPGPTFRDPASGCPEDRSPTAQARGRRVANPLVASTSGKSAPGPLLARARRSSPSEDRLAHRRGPTPRGENGYFHSWTWDRRARS